MENFSRYLSIDGTLTVMYCMFWIFSPADGDTLSVVAGSRVMLHCDKSSDELQQVTWRMNRVQLISFTPGRPLHAGEEAERLKINISLSQSELYALVIESAHKSHAGNYTCDIATLTGVWEKEWELIITEPKGNWNKHLIAVATVVPCVCFLIFVFTFAVLQRAYSWHGGHNNQPATTMQEETDTIYENCLEIDVRHQLKRQTLQGPSSPM